MNTVVTELEAAEAVLAEAIAARDDLGRRRIAATDRQAELAERRRQLAFDGLSKGGVSARRKLDEATTEAAQMALEIENITFALAGAEAKIAEAEAAMRSAVARANAADARAMIPELRAAGDAAAAGLRTFLDQMRRYYDVAEEIRRVSGSGFGRDIIRVNTTEALQAALWELRLNSQPLRRAAAATPTLDQLTEKWVDAIEAGIVRQLNDAEEEEAAE